jgi:hypothetical protein
MIGEIDILDTETDAFHEAQPRPIEEARHEMECAGELGQNLGDFLPCKHDGHPPRFLGMFDLFSLWERLFEDVTIEEDQGLQRDIVRGSCSLSLHGQIDQKSADVWSAHVRRVALMMEEDKALGPLYRRLCRSDAHVFEA